MHLVDVLRDLEKNLEELQKAIFQTEVDLNIIIAHSFLGPLTGECILNDATKVQCPSSKSAAMPHARILRHLRLHPLLLIWTAFVWGMGKLGMGNLI